MKTYGLLGYPLGHSFSKGYFAKKITGKQDAVCEYLNFSFPSITQAVSELKSISQLAGFNITIPYKEKIIPYLDQVSDTVQMVQSCNCVLVADGRWLGYNTDVIGFEKSLTPLLMPCHKSALVFGTGGASKAVAYVLNKLGIKFRFVSRTEGEKNYTYNELNAKIISDHLLLINTTPVGQFPNSDDLLPIPYNGITDKHLVFDLLYNPGETMFLKEARTRGAITKNGLEMLEIQAEESWKIWKLNY